MSMNHKDPERTEEATPKRRTEARNKGSVPKSGEITKFVMLYAGLLATKFTIGFYENELKFLFRWFLSDGMKTNVTAATANILLQEVVWSMAKMMLPSLLVMTVVAYIIMRLQVGELWVMPWHDFSFGKMFNPMAGIQKLFISPKTFVNLGRQTAQAAAIAIGPYLVLKGSFSSFLPLFYANPSQLATFILTNAVDMLWYAMLPMAAIAIFDVWYTRHEYNENLRMTKSEVKDERKQAEGDPTVKAKQREKMFKILQSRILQNVPKADVIITNPTHIAVALQYSPLLAPAPIVVAMGADHLAQKIKEIARENNIPIRENKPLARALYKDANIGEMIPEGLFKAVAAVLAQLDKFRRGRPR